MPHASLGPALTTLAELNDDIDSVSRLDDTFYLRYEDVEIAAEENEPRMIYEFVVSLGTPSGTRASATYETLLKYNLLRRETGVTMALSADNEVTFLAEVSSDAIQTSDFRIILENVLAKARAWRVFVASGVKGPGLALDDLFMTGIRV